MSLKFDLLEKFRHALFHSDGVPARNVHTPAQADYLVKMNIPPLLGRRDAACAYIRESLRAEIKDMPQEWRLAYYRKVLEVLEYAIIDTESVTMTLSSPETAGRERRVHTFLASMRDLLGSACAMAEAGSAFSAQDEDLAFFLGKAGKLSRYAAMGRDAEMRSLNLALDIAVAAADKFAVYREYNRKSFSTANGERYMNAYKMYYDKFRQQGESSARAVSSNEG